MQTPAKRNATYLKAVLARVSSARDVEVEALNGDKSTLAKGELPEVERRQPLQHVRRFRTCKRNMAGSGRRLVSTTDVNAQVAACAP